MRTHHTFKTLALATLAVAVIPASLVFAGDFGVQQESYKDMGRPAGVPVPAPMPVPNYSPSWYFRFDAGVGTGSEPDVSDDTFSYGVVDGPGAGPGDERYSPSSWFESDFNTFLTLGGGVGYYFGNGWRMDATVEKRSKDDANVVGFDEYQHHEYVGGVWTANPNQTNRMEVEERANIDGTLWMANAYYDFHTARGFTPYVGAGVGFAWNEIARSRTETTSFCDPTTAAPGGCAGGDYTVRDVQTAEDKTDKVTVAAAVMAGLSYDVSDMTAVDVGYRYMYVQGVDATLETANGLSRLEIGDQHLHQVRAGLRFNLH